MVQAKRENIGKQLTSGETFHLELETEPGLAKLYESDGEYGHKKSYMYNFNKTQIAFVSESLHEKMKPYHNGDSVIVSFVEKRWNVSPAGGMKTSTVDKQLAETEQMVALRAIYNDIQKIKQSLKIESQEEATKEEVYPQDKDVGF